MTSIEKLFEEYKLVGMLTTAMVNHYQEMHKEEIKKTWFDSTIQFDNSAEMTYKKSFEDYYEETFKQPKK
jgi:hypothetical protein